MRRGKIHDYLGMTLDYSENGKVVIRMEDYVAGLLEEARDDMSGVAVTPAADHIFQVNPNPETLSYDDGKYFHMMVAKLLFLAKWARPDIQEAVV